MKYWNVLNGKPYASYELEQKIANMQFWYSKNLEECFYFFVEALILYYSMSSAKKNAVNKLKNAARQAQYYKPMSRYDCVDNPVSLYAATKKSNELFAHCYSKLYDIPTTGLRFFTVYGPAGRPDMAYFGFTNKLLKGETIQIYNYGNCRRDFTYVDDIVEGIVRVMAKAPERKKGGGWVADTAVCYLQHWWRSAGEFVGLCEYPSGGAS